MARLAADIASLTLRMSPEARCIFRIKALADCPAA